MLLLWRFTVMGEMLSARAISLLVKRWARSASTSSSRSESGSIRLGWRRGRRGVSRRREGGQERGDEVGGAYSLCGELVQQGRHPRPQVDEDPDHPAGLGQGDGLRESFQGGAPLAPSVVEQGLQCQRLDQEAGVVSGLHDLVQPGQQARGFLQAGRRPLRQQDFDQREVGDVEKRHGRRSDVPVGLRHPAGRLAFPPLQQRQVRLERPGGGKHSRILHIQCVFGHRCGVVARRFDQALSLVRRRQPERAMGKDDAVGGPVLQHDCREIARGSFQVVPLIVGAAPEVLRPIQAFRKIALARQFEQMIRRLQEMREVGGGPVNEAEREQQTGRIGVTVEPVFPQALIKALDRPLMSPRICSAPAANIRASART